MDKELLRKFYLWLNQLAEREYFLSSAAYRTALVRQGLKPGALLTFSSTGKDTYSLWQQYHKDVKPAIGLDYYVLKKTPTSYLVLFFDLCLLKSHLANNDSRLYLESKGYDKMELVPMLEKLGSRFSFGVPHEVGVFLGIPVADIQGFIKHHGANSVMARYWKVYHNPRQAKEIFELYDQVQADAIRSIMAT